MTKALRNLKLRSFRQSACFLNRLRRVTSGPAPSVGEAATLHSTTLPLCWRRCDPSQYDPTACNLSRIHCDPSDTTLQYVTTSGDSATPHNTILPPCYTLLHLKFRSFSVLPLTEAQRHHRIQPSDMLRQPKTYEPSICHPSSCNPLQIHCAPSNILPF